jgi:short-subunit dehydrogenase
VRELRGRVALVTGASRGLGVAIARALAAEGMHLALTARNAAELHAVAEGLRAAGARVAAIPADVASAADRRALVDAAARELGAIDVLVNNAGVMGVGHYDELPPEEIERTIEVNLLAPMLLTQLVLPPMLARGSGHVVSITSLSAKSFPPYIAPYTASKAGLLAFTKSLRLEYRARGVSASAIIPGLVRDAGVFEQQRRETPVSVSPLLGTTTSEAVARAVVKAITRDRVEVYVNPQPLRPAAVLAELYPPLGLGLTSQIGAPIYERMANARRAREKR